MACKALAILLCRVADWTSAAKSSCICTDCSFQDPASWVKPWNTCSGIVELRDNVCPRIARSLKILRSGKLGLWTTVSCATRIWFGTLCIVFDFRLACDGCLCTQLARNKRSGKRWISRRAGTAKSFTTHGYR